MTTSSGNRQTPAGSSKFVSSVISAATQGAAGAVIGATLASVTDPITNRVLVKRMTISQAISEVDFKQMISYFKTTLPTNFVKFPLFEVLNELTSKLNVAPSLKGVVAGAIFTTATLPLTNYRYCKRRSIPFEPETVESIFTYSGEGHHICKRAQSSCKPSC